MAWNRAFVSSISVFFLLIMGCHSAPIKAPTKAEAATSDNEWLKDYQWAKTHAQDDPANSCNKFKSLASEKKFPAHDLALLRAFEICPATADFKFDRSQLPIWLQDLAIDAQLKVAVQKQDKATEMDLALEKSKQKLPQSEKVKWVNLAIQRAEELKLEDKQNEFKTRLYKLSPRLDPQPQEKQFLAVAGDWRMARQFDKAREYYEKVIASKNFDFDDKMAALRGIRLTYKNSRLNDQHLEASQRLVDFIAKALKANPRSRSLAAAYFDAQIYRGRALWTLGKTDDAMKVFNSLEKKMKGKVSLADLYWLKGRMAEENHDYAQVSKYLELALKEKFTDSEMRDKILWYCAWNERRRGNFTRALEVLQEIDKKTQIDFTRQRALYWLGRTYIENKDAEAAKPIFAHLIEIDPLGYYGLLAHRQLGLPITLQPPDEDAKPPTTAAASIPLDLNLADWLYVLEEKEALTGLLDLASQTYKKQRDQNDEGWVTIFKYYARGGLYMKLYESLAGITPERRKSIFEHHPDLLFPQPWSEDVRAAAQQFGIDEELIYAITRQESAFDTHARSLADAFGLMQLLPEVAEQLSTKYNIPYNGMEDLYDPKTNIYFGAAHLKELFQRQKGQFILAVASYNASESAIHNWMKNRFRGDALEFIEEIPYEETRAYVRLVMRNLVFYSLLKSKSAKIDFPDRVLKLEGS